MDDVSKPIPSQLPNPGVVTPHQADVSFADPLADAAEQMQHQIGNILPDSGDLAGEFSRVQQMIASQSKTALSHPPQIRPLYQPTMKVGTTHASAMVMNQQAPAPATVPTMHRPLMPNALPVSSNKRPRVEANGATPSAAGASMLSSGSAGGNHTGAPLLHANNLSYPGVLPTAQSGNRQKSQAQIDRRRERNRILARRTRLRKKFFFESLQKDVSDLQRENAALKSIVRSRLKPDDARAILSTCNANENLPSIIHDPLDESGMCGAGADGDVKELDKEDFNLIRSIQNSQQCFIITDPSLHDNPIVYASDDFLNLTGYSQDEVLGRNCRFLQGTGTCPEKVATIRKAVSMGEDVSVTLVNYTSDGTPFWNSLFIAALRDAENNIVNFIGVIVKVTGPEPGDREYGKILSNE